MDRGLSDLQQMGKISVDCIAPTIVIANKLIGLPATDHEFGCHNNASGRVMILENQDFFSEKEDLWTCFWD